MSEAIALPSGYRLRVGSALDRALLVKFMQQTYRELHPDQDFAHLAQTVEQHLSNQTPLWWVESDLALADLALDGTPDLAPDRAPDWAPDRTPDRQMGPQPVAGLWLGTAIDQMQGDRHTYVFLLYVVPAHRRRGIGTALMHQAEGWAKQQGDRQIGLQVFQSNQPALELYNKLGYSPQSVWMVKSLQNED